VRQARIDAGEAARVSSDEKRELRELRRKCKELGSTVEILEAATTFFARECARNTTDLRVHRRPPRRVRGRTDLPGTGRARRAGYTLRSCAFTKVIRSTMQSITGTPEVATLQYITARH
jgi:hypothetical protein